jgi:hypothetical protein
MRDQAYIAWTTVVLAVLIVFGGLLLVSLAVTSFAGKRWQRFRLRREVRCTARRENDALIEIYLSDLRVVPVTHDCPAEERIG